MGCGVSQFFVVRLHVASINNPHEVPTEIPNCGRGKIHLTMQNLLTRSGAKHGKVRHDIIMSILVALYHSRVAVWSWSVLGSLAITLLFGKYTQWIWLIFLVPIIWIVTKWKELLYEVRIIKQTIDSLISGNDPVSSVDDNLYLGPIPLQPDGQRLLLKKLSINAILSIFEGHEMNTTTLVGKPVPASDWKACNIKHLTLYMSEHNRSIDNSIMHQAADFINAILSQGERIYVHCRNGRLQSASIVLAYFVKYRQCNAQQAHRFLCKTRKIEFDLVSEEMEALTRFEKSFRS